MEREIYHESDGGILTLANVLITILLLALIGFGVWYFTSANRRTASEDASGSVHINLGGSTGTSSGTSGSGAQTY